MSAAALSRLALALALLGAGPLAQSASGDDELDAILEGFEEPAEPPVEQAGSADRPPLWLLGGALALSSTYNYAHDSPPPGQADYRGLSRLRAKLSLELDRPLGPDWAAHAAGYGYYDAAYALNGRDDYSAAVLDDMESDLELGETYLRGTPAAGVDVTLGRQIVVWGKSDNLRVTDVLNPLDAREIGLVDIEDLRLPLTMARLDLYGGAWAFSAMAIPEIRFNKSPPFGSDFYPPGAAPLDEQVPDDGGGNTEYAAALNGYFPGWDLALYAARLFNDQPHAEPTADGPELRHARLQMLGAALTVVRGSWLLKSEAAHLRGLEFTSLPGTRRARSDLLLGVEYAGLRDASLTLELVARRLHDYDRRLRADGIGELETQAALRYQGDFLYGRLRLTALLTRMLGDGGFARLSAAYDWADALTLSGGLVAYRGGDKTPFRGIGDNDRLFLELKYSF